MSTLLTGLQAEAWTRSVKLVADVSSEIDAELNPNEFLGCLTDLTRVLIGEADQGACISLVTSLEAAPEGKGMGLLRVQISAPPLASPRLDEAAEAAADVLGQMGATVIGHRSESAWTLGISLPKAKAKMSLATSLTAVVVDDDVDTQEFLAEVLRGRGFRVISVSDGFDALVAIERHRPDVVLTDILMPNMSGIDLVERIKHSRTNLPVIVFSGYRDELVRKGTGLPDKILPKPMSRTEVLKALDEVLQK